MVRLTRSMMPGKVLGAAIGGATLSEGKSKVQERQRSKLSEEAVEEAEDAVSAKRLSELEEKVIALLTKPASMPADKEEVLQAAVSRVSALEEELAATKKVSPAPCWEIMFLVIRIIMLVSYIFCIQNNNLKHYEVYDPSTFLNELICF
jgi:rRNA maturation endonuclease Nob1